MLGRASIFHPAGGDGGGDDAGHDAVRSDPGDRFDLLNYRWFFAAVRARDRSRASALISPGKSLALSLLLILSFQRLELSFLRVGGAIDCEEDDFLLGNFSISSAGTIDIFVNVYYFIIKGVGYLVKGQKIEYYAIGS